MARLPQETRQRANSFKDDESDIPDEDIVGDINANNLSTFTNTQIKKEK